MAHQYYCETLNTRTKIRPKDFDAVVKPGKVWSGSSGAYLTNTVKGRKIA